MSTRSWVLSSMAVLALAVGASTAASEESCVTCHGDPELLVKNKKLHDYFDNWKLSVHHEEDVTCSDCHGGNPKAKSKKAAHRGRSAKAGKTSSAINFRNIPETCATCHGDIADDYKKSKHYAKLRDTKSKQAGPNCVTCHGSLNASALDVTTVERVCTQCHDADNHGDVPAKAKEALKDLRAIERFTRYIALRGDPAATHDLLKKIEADRFKLSQTWHTFSIEEIEAKTKQLRDFVRAERDAVRKQFRETHKAE